MAMDDQTKMTIISEMIHDYWHEMERQNKRRYSQNEIAAHFGVNPTSLSYWLRKLRLPDEENKQRIADKLGYVEFYEAIGEQPRLPKNNKIQKIISLVSSRFINEGDIDAMIDWLEKRKKGKSGSEEERPASA